MDRSGVERGNLGKIVEMPMKFAVMPNFETMRENGSAPVFARVIELNEERRRKAKTSR